jgi:hypothetical protein
MVRCVHDSVPKGWPRARLRRRASSSATLSARFTLATQRRGGLTGHAESTARASASPLSRRHKRDQRHDPSTIATARSVQLPAQPTLGIAVVAASRGKDLVHRIGRLSQGSARRNLQGDRSDAWGQRMAKRTGPKDARREKRMTSARISTWPLAVTKVAQRVELRAGKPSARTRAFAPTLLHPPGRLRHDARCHRQPN